MNTPTRKTGKHPGGRPPKFDEPSQIVTLTLPKRTLNQLKQLDDDRAKAIVKAVDDLARSSEQSFNQAEFKEVGPGIGVLIVPPSSSLRRLPWLQMIEVATGRYLLAIEPGTSIEAFEVALLDMIEEVKATAPHELPLLEMLRRKLGGLRREERVSKAEILFIRM